MDHASPVEQPAPGDRVIGTAMEVLDDAGHGELAAAAVAAELPVEVEQERGQALARAAAPSTIGASFSVTGGAATARRRAHNSERLLGVLPRPAEGGQVGHPARHSVLVSHQRDRRAWGRRLRWCGGTGTGLVEGRPPRIIGDVR